MTEVTLHQSELILTTDAVAWLAEQGIGLSQLGDAA